jgi:hypothetical protein
MQIVQTQIQISVFRDTSIHTSVNQDSATEDGNLQSDSIQYKKGKDEKFQQLSVDFHRKNVTMVVRSSKMLHWL